MCLVGCRSGVTTVLFLHGNIEKVNERDTVGHMTKSRIFLRVLLAVIAGVGAQSFLPVSLVFLFVGAMGATAWLGVGVIRGRRGAWIPALFCLAFLCGMIRFAASDLGQLDSSSLYGKPLTMQGVIDEEPERVSPHQRIAVAISSINGYDAEKSFRVLATIRQFPAYAIGDEVKMQGAIEAPLPKGTFDEASYLKRRGVTATLFYPQVERIGEGKGSWLVLRLTQIKHAFENNIDVILPEPHAAFLKGLLIGERSSLPQSLIADFQITGTSHMIALSGYNITIIASAIQWIFLALTFPFALSFWLASGLIILFIIMTGASASVVRAGIMGLLLLIAQKEGRMYRMAPALAFAAAVMVIQNPYVLRFDAGFQLSFGATLGLVYISPYVEQWIDEAWRRARRDTTARAITGLEEKTTPLPKRILIETLAAQIAVLPLLIFLFGRVSLISPVVNVLVLVVTPYAMGIGFAAATLAFFSDLLGRLVGGAAWVILEYQLRVIALFARVPFAGVVLGNIALVGILIIYFWIAWRIWRK